MLFRSLVAALGASLALEVLASPLLRDPSLVTKREVPATHSLHERHNKHMGQHWSKRSRLPRKTVLPMRIGLKQANLDAGHDRLMAISDPSSPHHGKHMTPEEVIDFFAPDQSSVDAVIDWLVASGISRNRIGQSANKQWIQFDAPAEEAEDLLFTDFYVWEDSATGAHRDVACEQYHVPAHIQEHIDYITPGIRLRQDFAGNKRDLKKRGVAGLSVGKPVHRVQPHYYIGPAYPGTNSTSCSTFITADCVRAQYGVPNGTTAASGNELGIFEQLGDHYSKSDMDGFLKAVYPGLVPEGTYPENRLVDGAIASSEEVGAVLGFDFPAGAESNLDFQASIPLIWPQKTVLFQSDDEYWEEVGSPGFLNTFLDAIDGSYCTYSAFNMTGDCTSDDCYDPIYPNTNWEGGYQGQHQCGVYKPTNVVSISYGGIEVLLPDNYQKRQCNEYMKLGLQGTTVVVSSGDSGVASFRGCINGNIFTPPFPATCPYLLTVGSTELNRKDPSAPPTPWEKLDEVATTAFGSGGGFSNIYGAPSYQKAAVQAYYDQVESTLPFKAYHQIIKDGNFTGVTRADHVYHHGGRGFPDVAAVGDRQIIMYEGEWYTIGGTSLSAPIWGSLLTLVNEKRIAAGKGPIGFVNPILYSHPEAFNDVTVGSNPGCDENQGFPAAKSWDPVTGLGSPNFPKLAEILLNA